jgi:hypothetical protein
MTLLTVKTTQNKPFLQKTAFGDKLLVRLRSGGIFHAYKKNILIQ